MNAVPDTISPPVAPTTGGQVCNSREELAGKYYPQSGPDGNTEIWVAYARHAAYRAPTGQIWQYRGKKARVLVMLATTPGGVTQHDTLPWHTRLGGTIHAMREDGLQISTEIEGPYRHARYRLHTVGELIELAGTQHG
jgi:hypothetical protein